jgi:Ca-activated chloride channel family protein
MKGSELAAVRDQAKWVEARFVRLTADDADVSELARAAKFSTAATGDNDGRWEESGYWLIPLLAILMLPFARRGWMVSTAAKS